MPRRRRKNLMRSLPLSAAALALIGWGLWQAREFHESLLTELQQTNPSASADLSADPAPDASTAPPAPDSSAGDPPDNAPNLVTVGAALGLDEPLAPFPTSPEKPQFDESLTASQLAAMGARLLDQSEIIEGRLALNAALARSNDASLSAHLRDTLARLNASVFLGTAVLPDDPLAHFVEIQSGDSFLRIGREFGVTGDFVEALNPALKANNLKPLTGVKVVEGPFRIRLARSEARIDLYARDMYVCSIHADLPEGNYLPKGEYRVSSGTKLQMGTPPRTWIGFEGCDISNQDITGGWIYGDAGPRGNSPHDHATGIHLAENDLRLLYNTLVEYRSTIRVEP